MPLAPVEEEGSSQDEGNSDTGLPGSLFLALVPPPGTEGDRELDAALGWRLHPVAGQEPVRTAACDRYARREPMGLHGYEKEA